MTLYADALRAHLATYKRDRLGIQEHGIWRNNKRAYAHILPEAEYQLNILETIRTPFWRYFEGVSATTATHTDFHHLNSSQAFAFNLLFPFVGLPGSRPRDLLAALGVADGEVRAWTFEAVPDGNERTTFDFLAELEDGRRVFVEVKLTETNFGTCVPEDTHRRKLEEHYRPRLRGKTVAEHVDESIFFAHYQLFRNVSHLELERRDRLVLLVPRANVTAWDEAVAFTSKHLSDDVHGHVLVVAAEDVIDSLERSAAGSPLLTAHVALLREKYVPQGLPDTRPRTGS
jgi:hypothetical protein